MSSQWRQWTVMCTEFAHDRRTVPSITIQDTSEGGQGDRFIEIAIGNGRAVMTREQALALRSVLHDATGGPVGSLARQARRKYARVDRA